jgi:hypothetical protein
MPDAEMLNTEPGSAQATRYRVAYRGMPRLLSTAETLELRARIAQADGAETAPRAAGLWTEKPRDDNDIENALNNFDVHAATWRSIPDGAMRQAFRQLAADSVAGYRDAALGSVDRINALLRLLALPRCHLRQLIGAPTQSISEQHLRRQLGGAVCTPTAAATAGARRAQQRSRDEEDEARVRTAQRLALEGQPGRGARLLNSEPTRASDPATMLNDLRALHPPGNPPPVFPRPTTPLYTVSNVPVDAVRKAAKLGMSRSAPGPDLWTFELLHEALGHDGFARDFTALIVDILNGDVASDTCLLLAASGLVGIPKPQGGTRPIALGGTFLKVAATIALERAKTKLREKFGFSQLGVAVPAGGERIVHTVRRFLRTGIFGHGGRAGDDRVVLLVDMRNAFNSVSRDAMHAGIADVPELHGVFGVSYARHAPLHAVGCGATLDSARGARQGTVDGPALFSAALQPAINAASATAGVQIVAYLDDTTIMGETLEAAVEALETFLERAEAIGLRHNGAKCELIAANPAGLPAELPEFVADFRVVDVAKLLGASVGRCDADETTDLLAREGDKATLALRRMHLDASPQLFAMLRSCIVPKLGYAMRVHSPEVSRPLLQRFDASIEELLAHWTGVYSFNDRQRLIAMLPASRGGLGLTRLELVAPAAYVASRSAALDRDRRPVKQKAMTTLIIDDYVMSVTSEIGANGATVQTDTALDRHLAVRTLPGADAGLAFTGARTTCDTFGALLRTALLADASSIARNGAAKCPGCQREFAIGGELGDHLASCVIVRGGHVTKRHNAVVAMIRALLAEGGAAPEPNEPRHLHLYSCACELREMTHDQWVKHRDSCPRARENGGSRLLHSSGPDIMWTFGGTTKVADVTIVCATSRDKADTTPEQVLAHASAEKAQRYGQLCNAANVELIALPALSTGHLGPELISLINLHSAACFRDPDRVRQLLSATIAHRTATARLHAERLLGIAPTSIGPARRRLIRSLTDQAAQARPGTARAVAAAAAAAAAAPRLNPAAAPFTISLTMRVEGALPPQIRDMLRDLEWAEDALARARKIDDEQRHEEREQRDAATADRAKSVDASSALPTHEEIYDQAAANVAVWHATDFQQRTAERAAADAQTAELLRALDARVIAVTDEAAIGAEATKQALHKRERVEHLRATLELDVADAADARAKSLENNIAARRRALDSATSALRQISENTTKLARDVETRGDESRAQFDEARTARQAAEQRASAAEQQLSQMLSPDAVHASARQPLADARSSVSNMRLVCTRTDSAANYNVNSLARDASIVRESCDTTRSSTAGATAQRLTATPAAAAAATTTALSPDPRQPTPSQARAPSVDSSSYPSPVASTSCMVQPFARTSHVSTSAAKAQSGAAGASRGSGSRP